MPLSRSQSLQSMPTWREDSIIAPESASAASGDKMMKIQALLNPEASSAQHVPTTTTNAASGPPTPAFSVTDTTSSTPFPATPATTTSVIGHRHAKSNTMSSRSGTPAGVNYSPCELHEIAGALSQQELNELRHQYNRLQVTPAGIDRSSHVGDTAKHIPYSSDKKDFLGSTGKEGFNVFRYSFQVPSKPGVQHTVLWDYQDGLVRITPFFKARGFNKTTPNKALSTTPGLKALAHSVTGGSLLAQGYWLNYDCARALCATFCYPFRWALVPVFGPRIVSDCLPPSDPGYDRFQIDHEIVRRATLKYGQPDPIPRSVPAANTTTSRKAPPPRSARPRFTSGSPFDSDRPSQHDSHHSSPLLSPKSSNPGWTSINQPPLDSSSSLLIQPRFVSWRPADSLLQETDGVRPHHKRRRSTTGDDAAGNDADVSASETDIPPPSLKGSKRPRFDPRADSEGEAIAARDETSSSATVRGTNTRGGGWKSRVFTAEDARAAHMLLELRYR